VLKLTRSGKSYGQYGGASLIHHTLTVIIILGTAGVAASVLSFMFTPFRPMNIKNGHLEKIEG